MSATLLNATFFYVAFSSVAFIPLQLLPKQHCEVSFGLTEGRPNELEADELGINILNGPMSAEHVHMLGLFDAQDTLTKASKWGLKVSFKVYKSMDEVYGYDTTIPFSLWK